MAACDDMLARMMQMLMNDDFVEKLRAAKTPARFLDAIDARRMPNLARSFWEIPGTATVCWPSRPANGIAHTYMAAEA